MSVLYNNVGTVPHYAQQVFASARYGCALDYNQSNFGCW
jgi:hypothetical protein